MFELARCLPAFVLRRCTLLRQRFRVLWFYAESQGLDHHGAAIHSGKAFKNGVLRDNHESDLGSDHGNGNDISDRIHGICIFAYIYHTNQLNVGKYSRHGSYGLIEEVDFIRCPCLPQASMYPFRRLESATTGVGCHVPYFWKSLHDPLLWRLGGGPRSSHKINSSGVMQNPPSWQTVTRIFSWRSTWTKKNCTHYCWVHTLAMKADSLNPNHS